MLKFTLSILLIISALTITQTPIEASSVPEINFTNKELICLTKNIYYEANTEAYDGKLAVAQVTLNRARLENKDICSVVHARKVNCNYACCQFSWFCKKMDRKEDDVHQTECYTIALDTLIHGVADKYLEEKMVTHYHNTSVKPYWAKHLHFVLKRGNHLFYATQKV